MRILVVDDDDADHLHLQNLLTDGDHEIIRAGDPDRALQAVCEHDIRLGIANWSDSSMGALTLCRDIRPSDGPSSGSGSRSLGSMSNASASL